MLNCAAPAQWVHLLGHKRAEDDIVGDYAAYRFLAHHTCGGGAPRGCQGGVLCNNACKGWVDSRMTTHPPSACCHPTP